MKVYPNALGQPFFFLFFKKYIFSSSGWKGWQLSSTEIVWGIWWSLWNNTNIYTTIQVSENVSNHEPYPNVNGYASMFFHHIYKGEQFPFIGHWSPSSVGWLLLKERICS